MSVQLQRPCSPSRARTSASKRGGWVSEHKACAPGCPQFRAQGFSASAAARRNAHEVLGSSPGRASPQNKGKAVGQDSGVSAPKPLIGGKHRTLRPVAGQLHTPWAPSRCGGQSGTWLRPGNDELGKLAASLAGRGIGGRHPIWRRLRGPHIHGVACDGVNIGPRLARQAGDAARKPVFDAAGASVVGGCCETEVAAKGGAQLAQVVGQLAQRLHRLERVQEPSCKGGAGYELRYSHRALGAHRAGIESALLPDETREKVERKRIVGGGLRHHPAYLAGANLWAYRPRLRVVACAVYPVVLGTGERELRGKHQRGACQ